jgi:hypothetical protein
MLLAEAYEVAGLDGLNRLYRRPARGARSLPK